MKITEKLTNNLTEVTYLTVENTRRYRPIIRFFYEESEKMNNWLDKEIIHNEFKGEKGFEEYTIEQAESDLTSLTKWKNLVATQDTQSVTKIEDFHNRKSIYRISEYTIHIERLLTTLENLKLEGSSLEPTLIGRIREQIENIEEVAKQTPEEVFSYWESLNQDFRRMHEKYNDYINSFGNIKFEEIAQSEAFILRKNDLVNYLRKFIKILQDNSYKIEAKLNDLEYSVVEKILEKVLIAQKETIRIDQINEEFEEEKIKENNESKIKNMIAWFTGNEYRPSEIVVINDRTSEIIRKITRMASQIAESNGNANSRKEEFKKICELFCKTKTTSEAHMLSSVVFGMQNTRHIKGEYETEKDGNSTSLLNEEAFEVMVKPRIRGFQEKEVKQPIRQNQEEKEDVIKRHLEKSQKQKEEFEKLIKNNKIVIKELGQINSDMRKLLLSLITKAANIKEFSNETKTPDGKIVELVFPENNEKTILKCDDGELEMPAFELVIKEN